MFGIGPEFDSNGRSVIVVSPNSAKTKPVQVYDIDVQPIKINSVDTNKASGSIAAIQVKPNRKTANTSSLTALELSPRVTDVASGAINSLKADVVVKAATNGINVNGNRWGRRDSLTLHGEVHLIV